MQKIKIRIFHAIQRTFKILKGNNMPDFDILEINKKNNANEDVVNHPSHYTYGGIEVIDVIEAFNLDFHRGNVVKYVLRAGKKDPLKEIEDLEKAKWYLERYIKYRQSLHQTCQKGDAHD